MNFFYFKLSLVFSFPLMILRPRIFLSAIMRGQMEDDRVLLVLQNKTCTVQFYLLKFTSVSIMNNKVILQVTFVDEISEESKCKENKKQQNGNILLVQDLCCN